MATLNQASPGACWTRARGGGAPIKTFRRSWLSACKAAGVAGRIPHDFRRTAVRSLERAGVPRSSAMAMVGHKTESIYRRYAIVDAGALRDAAAKLITRWGQFSGTAEQSEASAETKTA
jgi:integrase